MKILVTGAKGFIGRNLMAHLRERSGVDLISLTRDDSPSSLCDKVNVADFIFHLAGVNRPQNPEDFFEGNIELTQNLCNAIRNCGRHVPVIYTSSSQADKNNSYGLSKYAAEKIFSELSVDTGNPVYLYRLPNVFGKWCRPNYNSVVATFCYNIINDLPIQINDPSTEIQLVYVDDIMTDFLNILDHRPIGGNQTISPVYNITIKSLAQQIYKFKENRISNMSEDVGTGIVRALYSTYITYFKPEQFVYPLIKHEDQRGVFVEVLKTKNTGQFSYFTAHPGITRGGHYHHSKTEKFLVVKGMARFKFRQIDTDETYSIITSGDSPQVVETIPGWSHDITNIGDEEMVVMLWANEVFDRIRPDTITYKV